MGDLYRALDRVLNRVVAIKVLTERLAADEEVRKRFRREALAAARLSDEPNTVTIFDVGEWRGRPFIVMEYLGGGTLEQVLRHGAQSPAKALAWLEQAASALDAAHERGVVHRDVKPANLLLDELGRVRVADFGIATAAGLDSLTLTGTVLGTVGYLSPEQAQGQAVTSATDRYALGVVAFELLTGTRPFARDSATAEAAAHAYERVPSAAKQNPSLPATVDAVFDRALAKLPADRFPSSRAFVAALRLACQHEEGAVTRRLSPVAAADFPTQVIRRRSRRRKPALFATGIAVALLAGGAITAASLLGTGRTAAPPAVKTLTRPTHTTTPTTTAKGATPKSPLTQAGASDLNTRGYRLLLAGNYAAALPLLQQAVGGLSDPTNPVTAYANFNLGQTLVRLGRCTEAMPYLQRALQLEPKSQAAQAALVYDRQCAGLAPANPAAAHVPPGHRGEKKGHAKPGKPRD